MAQNMGITWAFNKIFKRKFRFVFSIPGVVDDGISALPPLTAARPSIKFGTMEVIHLTETIYFPTRPTFEPIQLSLYDVQVTSPVWDWILLLYNPKEGTYTKTKGKSEFSTYKTHCSLSMLDGCGSTIESWNFDAAYVESANFGNLSMAEADTCMVDISLKYDRAYRVQ